MIRAVRMERFKCFDELTLPLSPLTLVTGFNAAGKSTALQTLLLLAQTLRAQRGSGELRLKGSLASLGTPGDIINRTSSGSEIALGLKTDEGELVWRFKLTDDSRRSLKATKFEFFVCDEIRSVADSMDGIRPLGVNQQCSAIIEILDGLVFLSASRQVDTDLFPIPEDSEDPVADVGPLGQFAPWLFYQDGDNPVSQDRSFNKVQESTTLRRQVNAWAGDLFPGVEFNALPISGTSQMRLEIKSDPTSDWTRPANIGYGITYAFPTLVAGLTAPVGSTLIIDSPEAHLHPRGQARMGAFLAQMASAGLQILVETHSDHVMDGVRIAIREGILAPEDAAFHYFTRSGNTTTITTPEIDADGRLSEWPEGFFDQHRRNMASLVKPKAG